MDTLLSTVDVSTFGTYTVVHDGNGARVRFVSFDGETQDTSPRIHVAEVQAWIEHHDRTFDYMM